jgi:ABC-type uncharacterized transport system substrate-binding protein
VELLKDLVENLSRVAVMSNPGNPPHDPYLRETERAATALGLVMRAFELRGRNDLPGAFAAMADWRAHGLVTLTDGMLASNVDRVVEWALKNKLPAVYPEADFVGPSLLDLFRRAASYVDKILKGAKVGDLPIEQPTKFELAINLKTAEVLGLTISREFQLRADEVVE